MKTFFVLALGVTLVSCAGTTPRIEPARLNEVQKGHTTVTQIVRQFGRPSVLSKNPDGTQIAMYLYADGPATEMTVVPLLAGVQRESVTFYFDNGGVLTNVKTTEANAGKPAPTEPTPASADAKPAPADTNKTTQTSQARTDKPTPVNSDKPAPASADNTPRSNPDRWSLPNWLPAPATENR